jgi:hypothetical protein
VKATVDSDSDSETESESPETPQPVEWADLATGAPLYAPKHPAPAIVPPAAKRPKAEDIREVLGYTVAELKTQLTGAKVAFKAKTKAQLQELLLKHLGYPTTNTREKTINKYTEQWEDSTFNVILDGEMLQVTVTEVPDVVVTEIDGHGKRIRELGGGVVHDNDNRIRGMTVDRAILGVFDALVGDTSKIWIKGNVMVADGESELRINQSVMHAAVDQSAIARNAWKAASRIGEMLEIESPLRSVGYTSVAPDAGAQVFHRDDEDGPDYWTVLIALNDSPQAGTRLMLPPDRETFYSLASMTFPWFTGGEREEKVKGDSGVDVAECEYCRDIFSNLAACEAHEMFCHSNPYMYDGANVKMEQPTAEEARAWRARKAGNNHIPVAPLNTPTENLALKILRGDNPLWLKLYLGGKWVDATMAMDQIQNERMRKVACPVAMEYADSCPAFTQGQGVESAPHDRFGVHVTQTILDGNRTMIRHTPMRGDVVGWDGKVCHAGSRNGDKVRRIGIMLTFHSGNDGAQNKEAIMPLDKAIKYQRA